MTTSAPTRVRLGPACALVAVLGGACAKPSGGLIILQNQKPILDSTSTICAGSTDLTQVRGAGVFDVDLDQFYPYFVYPLVENRLPSIKTSGGIERNSLSLLRVVVDVKAPAGVDPGWVAGCPAPFDSPTSGVLKPGETRALEGEGFKSCHAQRLRELIAAGTIPADLAQPVYFTLDLTVVADRSGSELESDPLAFQVKVCAGCLQSMFPLTPTCAAAPKPNLFQGNPCNIAQDGPPVLCCNDVGGALVCPAPSI